MIECDRNPAWDIPDRYDPGYSLLEIDVYAWSPKASASDQHRLSIRRNRVTQCFELYRFYLRRTWAPVEVLARGSLAEVLAYAREQRKREWGEEDPKDDRACDHVRGSDGCSPDCPVAYPQSAGSADRRPDRGPRGDGAWSGP